jgi:hypothetical protein
MHVATRPHGTALSCSYSAIGRANIFDSAAEMTEYGWQVQRTITTAMHTDSLLRIAMGPGQRTTFGMSANCLGLVPMRGWFS